MGNRRKARRKAEKRSVEVVDGSPAAEPKQDPPRGSGRPLFESTRNVVAILFAIVVVATLLRFSGLTDQGLWFDELCSVTRAKPDLAVTEILEIYHSDPHPPLHPLLLHAVLSTFGYSEYVSRASSAVLGIIGVLAGFVLGWSALDKRCGLAAAMIIAVSPYHIYFSREVRPYAMAFVFAALSLAAFLRLLDHQNPKTTALYAVSTLALVYTHYFGFFIVLGQYVFTALSWLRSEPERRHRLLISFGVAGGSMFVLYLPWIPAILATLGANSHWTEPVTAEFFAQYFHDYFGDIALLTTLAAAALVVLVWRVARGGNGPEEQEVAVHARALATVVAVSLILPFAYSLLRMPILDPRYTITTYAACVALIAMGFSVFPKRAVAHVVLIVFFIASVHTLVQRSDRWSAFQKAQLREATLAALEYDLPPRYSVHYLSNIPEHIQFFLDAGGFGETVSDARPETIREIVDHDTDPAIFFIARPGILPPPESFELLDRYFKLVDQKLLTGAGFHLFVARNATTGR